MNHTTRVYVLTADCAALGLCAGDYLIRQALPSTPFIVHRLLDPADARRIPPDVLKLLYVEPAAASGALSPSPGRAPRVLPLRTARRPSVAS